MDGYKKMKNLFLQQSCMDAWEDYQRSIRKNSFPAWDYVVLTSSNEAQAESFREQITYRRKQGVLPGRTEYIVLPDPEGKRVGSGGATLNALKYLSEEKGLRGDFHGGRVLMIHSGGDSKRVPQYSACGKLFSPVPRELPDGRASTLFDEFLIGMAGVPSRIREGLLVLSGDVLLLFNPLQIDGQFEGAAAISMKAPVSVGVEHGVYVNDGSDHVGQFLHKQPEGALRAAGAVNDRGYVDLDTGAVLLDAELTGKLYALVAGPGRKGEGTETEETAGKEAPGERYKRYVDEKTRLSFYGDFLYPLATGSTLGEYLEEAPEGEYCGELEVCRKEIWEAISPYSMKLISLSPGEFIHFGTTWELRKLVTEEIGSYEFLGWKKDVFTSRESSAEGKRPGGGTAYTSLMGPGVETGEGSYTEYSILSGETKVGRGAIASCLALQDARIPEDTVCHGAWLEDGRWVIRTYGVKDNPKGSLEGGCSYLEGTLGSFLKDNGLTEEDLWESGDHSLWKARLFPACRTQEEALSYSQLLVEMSRGGAGRSAIEDWKGQERYSLEGSFARTDGEKTFRRARELEDRILVEKFLGKVNRGEHYIPALKTFGEKEITLGQYRLLMERKEEAGFSGKIRILYDVSRSMKYTKSTFDGKGYDDLEKECFAVIQKEVASGEAIPSRNGGGKGTLRIEKNHVKVCLPVRVNWGGGWTDTPPYCNEKGGTVLNAAITLNGELPIEAEAGRLPRYEVQFASTDTGARGTVRTVQEIQDCHNPYDPFALHKAALIACGIIPMEGEGDLEGILRGLGGGISLSTRVKGIPKGSGLGTSSILAGACVKALGEFLEAGWKESEIYGTVLSLEQIMSTGGGWQDQVGGLAPGIKLTTSKPGIRQELKVEPVEIPESALKELSERFVLVYTGQRRLARNLLRDVVGSYIGGRPETAEALAEMEALAVRMKFALERGDIDGFAGLLNEHWEASKKLDKGSTNTCIEQIFKVCGDLIDGRFICGAGGGGFLQAVLKKGVTKGELSRRLREVFQDTGVDVWECEFV